MITPRLATCSLIYAVMTFIFNILCMWYTMSASRGHIWVSGESHSAPFGGGAKCLTPSTAVTGFLWCWTVRVDVFGGTKYLNWIPPFPPLRWQSSETETFWWNNRLRVTGVDKLLSKAFTNWTKLTFDFTESLAVQAEREIFKWGLLGRLFIHTPTHTHIFICFSLQAWHEVSSSCCCMIRGVTAASSLLIDGLNIHKHRHLLWTISDPQCTQSTGLLTGTNLHIMSVPRLSMWIHITECLWWTLPGWVWLLLKVNNVFYLKVSLKQLLHWNYCLVISWKVSINQQNVFL